MKTITATGLKACIIMIMARINLGRDRVICDITSFCQISHTFDKISESLKINLQTFANFCNYQNFVNTLKKKIESDLWSSKMGGGGGRGHNGQSVNHLGIYTVALGQIHLFYFFFERLFYWCLTIIRS